MELRRRLSGTGRELLQQASADARQDAGLVGPLDGISSGNAAGSNNGTDDDANGGSGGSSALRRQLSGRAKGLLRLNTPPSILAKQQQPALEMEVNKSLDESQIGSPSEHNS